MEGSSLAFLKNDRNIVGLWNTLCHFWGFPQFAQKGEPFSILASQPEQVAGIALSGRETLIQFVTPTARTMNPATKTKKEGDDVASCKQACSLSSLFNRSKAPMRPVDHEKPWSQCDRSLACRTAPSMATAPPEMDKILLVLSSNCLLPNFPMFFTKTCLSSHNQIPIL